LEGRISTTSNKQGEQVQGGVMGSLGEKNFFILCFSWEKEDNECVRGKLVIMCEEVLFMENNVCKQKSMERGCV
jgi:hypothetical protein